MTILSPTGTTINTILEEYKPSFVWDPIVPSHGFGYGAEDSTNIDFTVEDLDAVGNEPFCVWNSSDERFDVIYPETSPDRVLGDCGDFSDGKMTSYWYAQWDDTNLGFYVVSPTSSSVLGQVTGVKPDIYYHTSMPDVTYVDTNGEAQDCVIERSQSKSSTYDRTFQILFKSLDGEDPRDIVKIAFNNTANTRNFPSPLNYNFYSIPGSKGWWAISGSINSAGLTTNYISISFPKDTGRWYLACPIFYNVYSTFEDVFRCPIPRIDSNYYSRGQYSVYTANPDFSIPISGWLAMSLVPIGWEIGGSFRGLFSWECGDYRIRAYFSNYSFDNPSIIKFSIENVSSGTVTLSIIPIGVTHRDFEEFESIGIVTTWGISNGSIWHGLYVNGEVSGSNYFTPTDWISGTGPASKVYIGTNGPGGSAADIWIPRVAIGRRPIHRTQARILSHKMRQYTRIESV